MANDLWALEVVKGKEIGRVFPVAPGPNILGNAINGEPGIDLGSQEEASPRKMAARQAKLARGSNGLSLSDLDSPGGTFVNRQRILSGQTRKLEPGDILQLAGVQLKVVKQDTATTPTQTTATSKPGPLTTPYMMADGSVCRSWDDFLLSSSKSWTALRGELTSGKLESFLRANGHLGLLPLGAGALTSDERLDAWLGALPTTRPSLPELDIHPSSFRVKATSGGGLTRVKLLITNVGYRLLRSKIRVEPADSGILSIAPEWTSKPFTTSEQTEIPIDVVIPETVASPISAFLVVESNGGERRVEVRLEPVSIAKSEDASIFSERPEGLFDFLQHWTMARRIAMAASFAFGTRAVLSIIDGLMPSTTPRESFVSSLLVFMLIGPVLGGVYGLRKEGPGALVPAVLASGFAAIFFSTILQSLRRAIDVPLGTSVVVSCLVWTVLGIVVAVLSRLCIPPRPVPLRWSVEKSRS